MRKSPYKSMLLNLLSRLRTLMSWKNWQMVETGPSSCRPPTHGLGDIGRHPCIQTLSSCQEVSGWSLICTHPIRLRCECAAQQVAEMNEILAGTCDVFSKHHPVCCTNSREYRLPFARIIIQTRLASFRLLDVLKVVMPRGPGYVLLSKAAIVIGPMPPGTCFCAEDV